MFLYMHISILKILLVCFIRTVQGKLIFYNRQIKKFPTEKQNVSLKHILT
nr:MAG TPA: hypothetical protein [Caudoviricetes sp.]